MNKSRIIGIVAGLSVVALLSCGGAGFLGWLALKPTPTETGAGQAAINLATAVADFPLSTPTPSVTLSLTKATLPTSIPTQVPTFTPTIPPTATPTQIPSPTATRVLTTASTATPTAIPVGDKGRGGGYMPSVPTDQPPVRYLLAGACCLGSLGLLALTGVILGILWLWNQHRPATNNLPPAAVLTPVKEAVEDTPAKALPTDEALATIQWYCIGCHAKVVTSFDAEKCPTGHWRPGRKPKPVPETPIEPTWLQEPGQADDIA